ncbi:MAG: Outer rane lipoprotein LolB [Rhodocyclaceae bacterium]|nr:Outer rane lipoprotein LolB [Rhodocyclaceae bacterium]
MRALFLAGVLALAGCATVTPPSTGLPARGELRDFGLEARFALRLERPYEAPQSASGRLSWDHGHDGDHILVANPLGQGIAEIDRSAAGARLRTSDGRVRHAADAGELLQEATGYPLPLGELPAWLLGRPTASGQLRTDALGRPQSLIDAGWHIDYHYDSEAADALPSRLTLRRDSSLEVRLRIEEWRSTP